MRLKCENVGKVTRFYKMNEKVEIDNEIIHVYVVGGDEVNTDLGYIKLEITDTEAKHFAEDESEYCDATKINEHDSEHSFPIETEIGVEDSESLLNEDNDIVQQIDVSTDDINKYVTENQSEARVSLGRQYLWTPHVLHTCNMCGYSTHFKNNLTRHLGGHFKPKELHCIICKKPMKSKAVLRQHIEVHRCTKDPNKFKCNVCPYTSERIQNVGQHTTVHYRKKKERLKCTHCRFATSDEKSFKYHIAQKHIKPFNTKCPICFVDFKSVALFRDHKQAYKNIHNPNVYQCPKCSYTSKKFGHLKQHIVVHLADNEGVTFQCPHCPFKTKRHGDIKAHVIARHKTNDEVVLKNCDFCSYKTKRGHLLTCHMKNRHREKIVMKHCGLCSFKNISQVLMDAHVLVHSKTAEQNFLCSDCGFGCESQKLLDRHIGLRHKKDPSDTGSKAALDDVQKPNNNDDNNHSNANTCDVMIKEDSDLGIFRCLYAKCDFQSSHVRDVKIHKAICHKKQGEDNKCTECTFHTTSRFIYLEHLKVHAINIEHLKPYTCSVCGSKWIRKNDLTKHMSVMHWNPEKKV